MHTKPTLLILAAGMGSRYGGLKQLDEVGPNGEAIIDYSIYDAMQAGFGKVVFVIREELENAFRQRFEPRLKGKIPFELAFQRLNDLPEAYQHLVETREKPWGTGHAVWCAREVVKEPFAVINADDFYGRQAYQVMAEAFQKNQQDYFMVGYYLKNTLSDFGSVSRGICTTDAENYLQDVVERTKILKKNGQVVFEENGEEKPLDENTLVSMNFWGFQPSLFQYLNGLFTDFLHTGPGPKQEFYIPSLVNTLIKRNEQKAGVLESASQWFGITYREDKQAVVDKINQLVTKGVYPEKIW